MAQVGFAIVGLGVGASRAEMVTRVPGAKLACVCDLDESKAKSVAQKLGCDYYTDYHDMLDRRDVDVVGVLTPSGTHAEIGIEAAKAGKHVFTTKPMDISLEKCDDLIRTAERQGVVLAVDFQYRYPEDNRKAASFISEGGLGRLILSDLRMKWYREQTYYDSGFPQGWRKDTRFEGGSAANQGVHFLDLLLWFAGPVKEVLGRSATVGHEIQTEDLSVAMLTFKDGSWGVIETTTCNYPSLGTTIEITGQKGSMVWKDEGVSMLKVKDRPSLSLDGISIEPGPANIIEDMVWALTKGTPVAVDGPEGRRSVELFTAIYTSSRTGKPVRLG